MKFIEVEYNQDLKPLETVLSAIKRPGDFFVSGAIEMPMPKVEVEGAGTLSLPVPHSQIAMLIRQAERAPYGRGNETIVDMAVRNVWQIASAKVRVGGKSWAANFETILSKVRSGLGCEEMAVSAELYKLLVYDRDGFFLPHRDTEKADGMFGTLVITLPSAHRGGELRIRHAGREVTVDTSRAEFSELSYVAFYADCEHEALPVEEGNRVCLVYNLVQKRAKARESTLKAPEYETQIAEAAAILDRFLRASDAPAKIAWLLEYQYSPASLSFLGLKAADAAKTGVLVRAASRAQCAAHLGIVHIGESGAAEPDYDEYSYRSRWNRYNDYEDEDDGELEDEDEGTDFTAVTVDDSWQYIDEWRDTQDAGVGFGPIPLGDGELFPEGALDGEPPDKKRLTEASGNEGASYERSYHRAALVLWPQECYADVLLHAGVVAALPYLNQLIADGKKSRPEAIALAERMVEAWQKDARLLDYHSAFANRPEASHRTEIMSALGKLEADLLLERFITCTVTPSYDGSENAALISSVSVLGHAKAEALLSALISARMRNRPQECAELLEALSEDPARCFLAVAAAAIDGLDRIGTRDHESEVNDWEPEDRRRPISPQFLVNLFQALRRFKKAILCDAAAEKIAARPEIFKPVTFVVPALEQFYATWGAKGAADRSIVHLWTNSARFLLQRSEFSPEPPADWRLDVQLSCSCPDCRELQAFSLDPLERIHRFRIKKERRQHLHNMIDRHRLDMTHITERVGSPQTLVCTKDGRTFDRRMKEYKNEIGAMRSLLRMAPKTDGAAALCGRMKAAANPAAR